MSDTPHPFLLTDAGLDAIAALAALGADDDGSGNDGAASDDDPPDGPTALAAHIASLGLSIFRCEREAGVAQGALRNYLARRRAPAPAQRARIALWSGGAVPLTARWPRETLEPANGSTDQYAMTCGEIAAALGLSRVRVQEIERTALAKLRRNHRVGALATAARDDREPWHWRSGRRGPDE